MDFYTILDQILALLRQRQCVTSQALQRQFPLDETALNDLKAELLYAYSPQHHTLYTPPYRAEKMLLSRRALEGERQQARCSLPIQPSEGGKS